MHEVWITNGNGTDCFIVGGLTRTEALIVKDNIEYGIDVLAWTRPEPE